MPSKTTISMIKHIFSGFSELFGLTKDLNSLKTVQIGSLGNLGSF